MRSSPGRLLGLLLAVAPFLAGCGSADTGKGQPANPPRSERIDHALSAGTRFLIERQSDDGAWRSDRYEPFTDGTALTPLVLHALLRIPDVELADPACRKAADFLATLVRPDGTVGAGGGLNYPVYTAAFAVLALSDRRHKDHMKERDAWLAYLRRQQLTEALGWAEADPEYGGWGYATAAPQKRKPDEPRPPLTGANLSATAAALRALRAAGFSAGDPAFRKARTFVERCQNFNDDPARFDPAFDDGGFFFSNDDPGRNKAGAAGEDRNGRPRFTSYGSTTADGLLALPLCGVPVEHARVRAARRWLETAFEADDHPGRFGRGREAEREGLYFYYCCSAARALRLGKADELKTRNGKVVWADALADALTGRQLPDGSWSSPVPAMREDDPLVATALALEALAACRPVATAPERLNGPGLQTKPGGP